MLIVGAQHTTGRIRYDGAGDLVTVPGGEEVATTYIYSDGLTHHENGRRLVACWNACDGITTERLEDLGKPLLGHLIGCDERAARMVKERDELLTALRVAEEAVGDLKALEVVRAAIAKVQGGAL